MLLGCMSINSAPISKMKGDYDSYTRNSDNDIYSLSGRCEVHKSYSSSGLSSSSSINMSPNVMWIRKNVS